MKKKLFSILLSLAMVVTMMPMATMTVFATEAVPGIDLSELTLGQGWVGKTVSEVSSTLSISESDYYSVQSIKILGLDAEPFTGQMAQYNDYLCEIKLEQKEGYEFPDENGYLNMTACPINQNYTIYENPSLGSDCTIYLKFEPTVPSVTIADILPKDFPTNEEDAWVSDGKVCYLDAYGSIAFEKDDNEFVVDKVASVTKNENNYVWETPVAKITFIMNEDGELSSIAFYTTNDEYNALNGTYTPPVTEISEVEVEFDFDAETPKATLINSKDKNYYLMAYNVSAYKNEEPISFGNSLYIGYNMPEEETVGWYEEQGEDEEALKVSFDDVKKNADFLCWMIVLYPNEGFEFMDTDDSGVDMTVSVNGQPLTKADEQNFFNAYSPGTTAYLQLTYKQDLSAEDDAIEPAPYNPVNDFNAYKVTAKAECDKVLTAEDSEAVKKLVTDAKSAIDNAKYDTTKTLADNKLVLDSIVSELKQNVIEQRADEDLTKFAKATKMKVSKAKAIKRGKIKLTYKSADKGLYVTKYQIYRSTKRSSGFKKIATTSKKTYTDSKKLKKGKKYYYKVRGMVKLSTGKYTYTKWSSVKKVKAK